LSGTAVPFTGISQKCKLKHCSLTDAASQYPQEVQVPLNCP
jgi:hypothetical protein